MKDRRPDDLEDALGMAEEVLSADTKDLRSLLHKHLVLNAIKCKRDDLDILDLKVINRAITEFRHAARIFKPYRSERKVSIFGSARVAETNPYYQLAVKLGRLIAGDGLMVITGAADGIMKAGIEGAGPENSFGVSILLPFENEPTSIIRDDAKLIRFKYFFTRKIFFVMEADAIVLFPGGFGTHDEGFEVLTLLQTGKAPPMPVVLMELPGEQYWEEWDRFIRHQLLPREFISPEDLSFYQIKHSAEEAMRCISSYYSTYHSMRQVRDQLVIRLERELRDEHVAKLNEDFLDLVESGGIAKTIALPAEEDEPALLSKPRIAFVYNKRSAGRLNEMILTINRLGHQS